MPSKLYSTAICDDLINNNLSQQEQDYLVDIFDVYDKVQAGLVDKSHLDTRMRTLKFGVMKTPVAKGTWASWKPNRDEKFVKWFEKEIFGDEGFVYDQSEAEERRANLNTHRD